MSLIKSKQEVLNNYPSCYACDAPKTSMEHAPPRCFFPEEKDDKGNFLFRRDLIKVPSCDKHNAEKSGHDAYAVWQIAGMDGVNGCGEMVHAKLKKMARYDREKRGGAFLKRLVNQTIGFTEDGRVIGKSDGFRMESFLLAVARAVYFAETFKKQLVPLKVTNIGNYFGDANRVEALRTREEFFEGEMGNSPALGSNPDVFQYTITHKPEGTILVRLVFYGTLKHWVFFNPSIEC